ncbi:MAG: insulinase family protein [Chlamydiales bacterium]|nr:insulinase family protein [Chlamydiales bacterium]
MQSNRCHPAIALCCPLLYTDFFCIAFGQPQPPKKQKAFVGKELLNFTVTKSVVIDELQCTLTELVHEPSGAQVLHLGNDDEENLFNLSFSTHPSSSDGVAHILEHTVLCGSQKYPIPDPFFEMTRRSLNTFMNALTGPDFTCYPASSQVKTDFYNLLDVYIDSVFHPLLTKESFLQEGHRLEFSEKDNPKSKLTFQGIVFNEMKGAMASGEARLNEFMMEALYPNLTYAYNSGGDPKEIPNLTYEELKKFHEEFYHPSRCLFYFYGNIPLEEHLNYLEEKVLKGVKKLPPLPHLPKQKRFSQPHYLEKTYPIAEGEDEQEKSFVAIGCLTCSVLEQEELLALNVLDMALMGTDASPLKTALLRSNLCKQADSFIDNEMSEPPFFIVCKGCKSNAAKKLEEVIAQTLGEVVKEGLPAHTIEGAIHQLEMARTEIVNNHSPFGLTLFFRSGLLKQLGGNPKDGLHVHTLFSKLREKVTDSKYLTRLIEKHFLHNPHHVVLTLNPDKKLAEKEVHAEEKKLETIQKSLSAEACKKIIAESHKLVELQEAERNREVLPKVTIADVSPKEREFALTEESNFFKLNHHDCFTNDILYADLVYDLPDIAEEDLSYLRLFTFLVPQLGCGGRDYAAILDEMMEYTGGIGLGLDLNPQDENPTILHPSLSIRGKALGRNKHKLFPLMRDMITSVDFTDKARMEELLMQHYHAIESSIQHNALKYAVNLAASGLSVPGAIIHKWYGLEYFKKVQQIVEQKKLDPLIEKMQELQQTVFGLEFPALVLSCDQNTYSTIKQEKFYGLEEIPTRPFKQWKGEYSVKRVESQGRIIASPVAFTAQLFQSVPYSHPNAPLLSICSEIMVNSTLHKRIREQGGAYGSGAVNGVLAGNFYLFSFRDPNYQSTLDAFKESIDVVASGEFGEREIEEAKLGLFQELDSPVSPGARAEAAFFRLKGGRTAEKRQQYRDRLLQAKKEDIQRAAQAHLIPGLAQQTTVSFAGKDFFEKEKTHFPLYPI